MKDQRKSILEMARGAILERVDEEVKRVIVNIMDCLLYTSDAADE